MVLTSKVQENNMINFKEYLTEAAATEAAGKPLKHLTHVEDSVIHGGHEGVALADSHLRGMHNLLLGKSSGVTASTKWDGAPSIVFGQHPQTRQFFVGTKSAFNATPKINYTDEDIETNHGHAPGLVEKLKAALQYLPHIMPRTGGVYQGDLMHTEGDAKSENGMTSVTPNTISYGAPNGSAEAENMKKKLGIVVHTRYKGPGGLAAMDAGPLDAKTRATFGEHPDVNNIDPTMHANPSNYTTDEQKEFLSHMERARQVYSKMKPEAMDAIAGHGVNLEAHINDMIRKGGDPSVMGYMQHLTDKHNKDIAKLKSQKSIDARNAAHAAILQHITENSDHFQRALDLHKHFQDAKNVLVGVMAKNNAYAHSVDGAPTDPEGAVISSKDGMTKFVNRKEFSRLNFLKGAFQKKQTDAAADEASQQQVQQNA
jgi:hypothetical protein